MKNVELNYRKTGKMPVLLSNVYQINNKIMMNMQNNNTNWDREEQLKKNQPLMNLMKKWLEEKKNIIPTPKAEAEYQEIQNQLLKNRLNI